MLEELREAVEIVKKSHPYATKYKGVKEDEALQTLINFAQLILDSKGFPKPMEEKTINLERADDPSYVEGEEWNSCLSFCIAAHVKEKAELIGKIPSVEEISQVVLEQFKIEGDKDTQEVIDEVYKHGLSDVNSWDNKEAGFFDMKDYSKKIAQAIHSELMKRLK